MHTVICIVVVLCLAFSSGAATLQTEHEDLAYDFEPRWQQGYYQELPNQVNILELIREGDDINNWQELITIRNQSLPGRDATPEDAFKRLKIIIGKDCRGLIQWNVIEKKENSILYEWMTREPCMGFPNQHEIAKIMDGKYNRFQLKYTVKVNQLPANQRAKWLKRIGEAKIETRR